MTFHRVTENWTGYLFLGMIAMVLAVFGYQAFRIHQLKADVHERTTQRDSLAGEAVAERARADGWEAVFAKDTEHLAKRIREGDSLLEGTVRDLQASRARVTQLTRMVVSFESQISSPGTPDTVPGTPGDRVPPSWSGEVDDGLLKGSWTFKRIPTPLLFLDLVATPEIELIQATSGDGRVLVLARGVDPRVTPIFKELRVDPLPPVVELHCPLTRLGLASMIGAGAGFLSGIILK